MAPDQIRERELQELRTRIDRSYEKDADRWQASYRHQTASALHERALAAIAIARWAA